MTAVVNQAPPPPRDESAPPQKPDYRRVVLPVVLAAPVLLLMVLTELPLSDLGGGLLRYTYTEPGSAIRGVVIAASVSSVLGMLICRWRRWWGVALATWPFLLILVTGTFVWAWLPALIGISVIVAVDDWRRAIPAWAASLAVGAVYCLSGVDALILGNQVTIRLTDTDSAHLDLPLAATYVGAYLLAPTVAVLLAAAVGLLRRARLERSGAHAVLRDALATEQVVTERARIARDLHDVVAHHISLVAIRAESAPFVHPGIGEQARAVLGEIADDARRALDELRQVLTVLERTGGEVADRAPQPGAADVPALIAQANAAGQHVTSSGGWAEMSAPTGYVLYRVVQEALSNARRHAPGRPVEVAFGGDEDAVTVTVSNPVDERERPGPAARGLLGMRERVRMLGGTVEAGLAGGRFTVSATLPRTRTGQPE